MEADTLWIDPAAETARNMQKPTSVSPTEEEGPSRSFSADRFLVHFITK